MALRRRVEEKTRAQQFGDELTDGLGHFRSAAMIAAERAAEAVAPRVDNARGALAPRLGAAREAVGPRVEAARDAATKSWGTTVAAVAPIVTAAAESARQATEEARKQAGQVEKRGRAAKKEARLRAKDTARALRGERSSHRRWPWVVGILGVGIAAGVIAAAVSRRNAPHWDEYEPEHEFAEPSSAFAAARDRAAGAVGTAKEKATHAADTVRGKAKDTLHVASDKADEAKDKATDTAETKSHSANGHKP
ncbi:MAG TPA: hypothetical protein VGN37_28560 [Actinocatenispora sp.]